MKLLLIYDVTRYYYSMTNTGSRPRIFKTRPNIILIDDLVVVIPDRAFGGL